MPLMRHVHHPQQQQPQQQQHAQVGNAMPSAIARAKVPPSAVRSGRPRSESVAATCAIESTHCSVPRSAVKGKPPRGESIRQPTAESTPALAQSAANSSRRSNIMATAGSTPQSAAKSGGRCRSESIWQPLGESTALSTLAVQVTPSAVALEKSIGGGGGHGGGHSSLLSKEMDACAEYWTGATAVGTEVQTPIAHAGQGMVANVEKGQINNGEEKDKRDKLAAVDAIFAAAKVIAKRSPSPPTSTDIPPYSPAIIHHGSADDTSNATPLSSTATVIHTAASIKKEEKGNQAQTNAAITTPKPKRPMKKRKVSQPQRKNTPKKAKQQSCKSNDKSLSSTCSKSASPASSSPSNNNATTESPDQLSPQQEQELTSRAIFTCQTIEDEPALYRALLLHMALERETPRKPGGGAPDHYYYGKVDGSKSGGGSNDNFICSTFANGGSTPSGVSGHGSNGGSGGEISIGKRRGNQYVQGVSTLECNTNKVITDGFFWKDVPELEGILQKDMEEYYEMSENRPQSKKQQQFNNHLVDKIHETALQCGYTFDPLSFGSSGSSTTSSDKSARKKLPTKANKGTKSNTATEDTNTTASSNSNDVGLKQQSNFNHKKLRDRIRCYYKTHVQNSKKRLITLLKNPTRPKNREVLIKIVNDIRAAENNGGAGRRKLSPDGKAALQRLERKERSLYPNLWRGVPGRSLDLTTPARQPGIVSVTVSSSSSCEEWTERSVWHAPPSPRRMSLESPRRVSMDASRHSRRAAGSGGKLNSEVPLFASPCKPEHVAMLQSIRKVSVRL